MPYISKISKIKHSNIIMIMTTSDDDDDDDDVTMTAIKSNNIVFSLSVVFSLS